MMKKEEYINEVTSLIKNKTAKRDVKRELENHIDDRAQYFIDAGYDEDYSFNKAVEMMGNPKEVAESLEKLHNNTLWTILSLIFLGLYACILIYADFNMYSFAYINIVDFSETDAVISIISVIAFCAATASFYFAVKSKSIGVLRALGITTILTPLISFYALRPAGYQFISVFTDFPAAVKMGEAFFGWEAFCLFFKSFGGTEENVFPYFIWVICFFLIFAFPIIHVVTGFLSLVYAGDLRSEANCSNCEKALKKLTVFLITVSAIMVIGTSVEIIRDMSMRNKDAREYYAHMDDYYTMAKAEFDSIEIPLTEEDAKALQEKNDTYGEMDTSYYNSLKIYINSQVIELRDYEKDGIYESKQIFNYDAHLKGIEKGTLEDLEIGSPIEDLYDIADFSSFMSYEERKAEDGVYIELRIVDENDNEQFWFNYKDGKLTHSTLKE